VRKEGEKNEQLRGTQTEIGSIDKAPVAEISTGLTPSDASQTFRIEEVSMEDLTYVNA
jgi:hypothetical protein